MIECKYILPCGLCDRSGDRCNQTLNSSFEEINLVSAMDYNNSIEALRVALITYEHLDEDSAITKAIKLSISALQRERDRFFPGKWTNKFKKGGSK